MNVLLLGNGFDINCGLPTKYINFLQIVDFIDRHRKKYMTVGELFKAILDENPESSVASFYNKEKQELMDIYDSIEIDNKNLQNILTIKSKDKTNDIRNNTWFSYFLKNHLTDMNWVGFEREMEQVLIDTNKYREITNGYMDELAKYCDPEYPKNDVAQSPECRRIVNELKTFNIPLMCYCYSYCNGHKTIESTKYESKNCNYLKSVEDTQIIQWDNIYKHLEEERLDLVHVFKNYLTYFVEKISDDSAFITYANKQSVFLSEFSLSDIVISFNYTKTFEKISLRLLDYNGQQIDPSKGPIRCFHIHGRVDDENIVMGIKPSDDMIEPLHFQKDVQRFRYGTNSNCIAWLRNNEKVSVNRLTVMGCSLDVTDGDIIKKLFYKSHRIRLVYYGDDDALYCKNIKSILGTDGLENLQERFIFKDVDCCKIEYSDSKNKHNEKYVLYTPGTLGQPPKITYQMQ